MGRVGGGGVDSLMMSYKMNISNKCAIKDTNIGLSCHEGLLLLLAAKRSAGSPSSQRFSE